MSFSGHSWQAGYVVKSAAFCQRSERRRRRLRSLRRREGSDRRIGCLADRVPQRDGARDGRITVLISHRFSTVRMADLIVVLDGARAVEVGSHDALMARGGQYAQLYGIQAAAYVGASKQG